MRNKKIFFFNFIFIVFFILVFQTTSATAQTTDFETNGHVNVEASEITKPLDPEGGASTKGDLRIDFVSPIDFADAKITPTNRKYLSLAQLFTSDTSARAPFVQITDIRNDSPGWSLQLKQESQFMTQQGVELDGAVMSFDKGWASSVGDDEAPVMFKDTISIDDIGQVYQVASAKEGTGSGVWMLSFGASKDNEVGLDDTLSPLLNSEGEPVIDKVYKKEMYTNSAISLSVPDQTDIVPEHYQTELTWILQVSP